MATPEIAMPNRIEIDMPAPDFTLQDYNGNPVRLGDYRGRRHVVLVFNRGFT
jgi:peroxiredoxin